MQTRLTKEATKEYLDKMEKFVIDNENELTKKQWPKESIEGVASLRKAFDEMKQALNNSDIYD